MTTIYVVDGRHTTTSQSEAQGYALALASIHQRTVLIETFAVEVPALLEPFRDRVERPLPDSHQQQPGAYGRAFS